VHAGPGNALIRYQPCSSPDRGSLLRRATQNLHRPIHLFDRFRPFPCDVDDADVRLTRASDVEEFYREHVDRLWRALYAYTGDRELASDAAASAIEQCLRRGESVRSPADWIWRAAFRIARGELSRSRRDTPERPESAYWMPEPLGELMEALLAVPAKQRAALVLHYYLGYTAKEIASMLGSTSPTVRVQLSQGRKRLRRILERSDDE
jgi:RNA polymerase sigma factor (sigma-70 family)